MDLPPETHREVRRPARLDRDIGDQRQFDDVAKRLPPPLNAEEETFQKVMRAVAPRPPRFAAASTGRTPRRREKRGHAQEGVRGHRSVLEAEESGADPVGAERQEESRVGAGRDGRGQMG